jgi:Zn-dependent alcohol dehydrogenase
VIGCGGVGLNVIQAAALAGARDVIAVDVAPAALELASALGATATVNSAQTDAVEAVRRHAGGGVDCAFEALGRPATIELALELTGRGGQAVLIGMAGPDDRVPIDPLSVTVEERVIRGCWYGSCRPAVDFPVLVDLYRAGRIRLDAMVEPIGLADLDGAFAALRTGRTGRAVVVF